MSESISVSILLSTYNGDKYISRQLDSLVDQTFQNWELLVRDDGSTDQTVQIISSYMERDKRIKLLKDDFGNLRSSQSFGKLMQSVSNNAEYIMFCDQDDIWHKNKIEKSLLAMSLLGDKNSIQPLMAYGTYNLVDENDRPLSSISPDYSRYPTLNYLLAQTYIYGCTMIINRTLLNLSIPIPSTAENHDYWISLVCLIHQGNFGYMENPLIQYRQHTNNVSGSFRDASFGRRLSRLFSHSESLTILKRLKMFESLHNKFINISNYDTKMLKGYIESFKSGRFSAVNFCIKNNIIRNGKFQTLLFYFNILKTK